MNIKLTKKHEEWYIMIVGLAKGKNPDTKEISKWGLRLCCKALEWILDATGSHLRV